MQRAVREEPVGRLPLFMSCREGLFSETRIQALASLSNETGAMRVFAFRKNTRLPQDVVASDIYAGATVHHVEPIP
jgi:hypothetical protein